MAIKVFYNQDHTMAYIGDHDEDNMTLDKPFFLIMNERGVIFQPVLGLVKDTCIQLEEIDLVGPYDPVDDLAKEYRTRFGSGIILA